MKADGCRAQQAGVLALTPVRHGGGGDQSPAPWEAAGAAAGERVGRAGASRRRIRGRGRWRTPGGVYSCY